MPKKLIILVHGMGTHPKGVISKEFKKAIADRAKGFGITDQSFLNNVDYSEFNYSEYFDAIRKQFTENAQARKKGFRYLAGQGFAQELLTQITSFEANFGKDEFFYTHWLDVILYSTMYFGEKIRFDFISFFEKQRKKYDHKNIHIVCHSLGTALVHDALAKYYRKDSNPYDDIPDLPTGNFNISSLWTFANLSRMVNLLNCLTDPLHSTVAIGKDGCTSNFINIRHKYDPFTWFKSFDREMGEGSATFENKDFRNINTHDFYEYITEPNVARAILNFVYEMNISDKQLEKGMKDYLKGCLRQEDFKELKKVIESAQQDLSIDSIKAATGKYKEIWKRVEDLSKSA